MNPSISISIKKFLHFLFTSGIGFIMDFTVYFLLTQKIEFEVFTANCISSLVGASFVFVVSTHKIFSLKEKGLPVWCKYLMYILYQMLLIFVVSLIGGKVNYLIESVFTNEIIVKYSKLISKVMITPITVFCNFIVSSIITEKI